MVTRFRSTGEKRKPHSTKEGRSAEAQPEVLLCHEKPKED